MRLLAGLIACVVSAQVPTNPIVQPRGVVNAFTQTPAPSLVGAGGVVTIRGLNLAEPVTVLVNNREARVLSATATEIVAQLPSEFQNGLANVVVRKGEASSRGARVQVAGLAPSWKTENGAGYGPPAVETASGKLRLFASGLGAVDENLAPRQPVKVFVDGKLVEAEVKALEEKPGVFAIEIPAAAMGANTPVLLAVNNANSIALPSGSRTAKAEVLFVGLPEGAPALRSLRSTDVNGRYLTAAGQRGQNGCYPSFWIEVVESKVTAIEGCPTIAQAQLLTPFVEATNSTSVAALEGARDKLRIWRPGKEVLGVALPEAVQNLTAAPNGAFVGNVQGRLYEIDSESGAVTEREPPANPVLNPGGAQNIVGRLNNLDLGDGLTEVLSVPSIFNNQILVTVGDALDNPKKAKLAVLNAQIEVQAQRDFPEGWLPLTAPAPPTNPGMQQPQLRQPTPTYFDGGPRSYYAAAIGPEGKHGFVHFPAEGASRGIPLPEGWTFTACIAQMPIYNLELARRIALLASRVEDRTFKNPCPADGYAIFDLATREFNVIALPGSGQLNVTGGALEMNDFLIGSNTDPARRNTADTLYALDGVNETAFRFDLPSGVNNFSGNNPVPAMNLIVAAANNRTPGDAGLIVFDLERTEAKLLPTPEGFAAVNFIAVAQGLRKLIARGMQTGNTGAQVLIYDLVSGDLEVVPNPEGVAFVGPLPQTPQQPGQPPQPPQQQVNVPIRFNSKTNSLEAVGYGEDRRQRGIVVIRVP